MALPAENVQLVDPPEINECAFCGARSLGAERRFVSFNNTQSGDAMPAALIQRMETTTGRRITTAREPTSGRSSLTVEEPLPMICEDCGTQAARLLGLVDELPLRATIDDLERQRGERDATIADLERQRGELENAVAHGKALETIAGVQRRRKPAAAVKPKAAAA
jgi:hypothetical protein